MTSWALGSCLESNHRVLFFDVDPQRTLSSAVANLSGVTATGYDVLVNKVNAADAIIFTLPAYGEKAKLIPAGNLLTGLETATASNVDRQFMFADAVACVADFKFIIFDCPSSQGILTTGPLVASDVCISPVACAPAAFEALEAFHETIRVIQHRLNPRLKWFILPTLYDGRQVLDREVLAEIHKQYGSQVLAPPIRKRVSLSEQMAHQHPCTNEDYENFTKNFLERIRHETISTKTSAERARSPP
jgi:chromosome partitioning protein